ncbi:putative reverse transcriptase domain-containing protein [Tanacetum coccineum]|uniref:Reverse transcriptase domain-containing protein n=1 Tax=Tanacetum coccineum TaxID=301880 RepID=A0ABQ5IAB5_9ASTR
MGVLHNAPILSLPDEIEDFVVYYDASNQGLGCVLIKYHPGKANVVADALSRKERVKPRRVRAMDVTIQSKVKRLILAAQGEALKDENVIAEGLNGTDQQMEKIEDGSLHFMDRIWFPLVGGVRTKIMDEAYKTRSPVLWGEIGDSGLIRPELVQETTNKVVMIRDRLPIVKVRWNSKRGPEFTWEREDHMEAKYPQLFENAIFETNG